MVNWAVDEVVGGGGGNDDEIQIKQQKLHITALQHRIGKSNRAICI